MALVKMIEGVMGMVVVWRECELWNSLGLSFVWLDHFLIV